MPFQCYFPFNHCLMSDTAGFTYTEVSNVIYSAVDTEYTSSDSLPSHWICMCFMLGPEWICMAKTRFQWDKGSLESWTVFLLKKKKLLFTFLLPAGVWGRREAVWAGRSHHISLSSVTLGDTMLLNSIFCPFFSLCVGLFSCCSIPLGRTCCYSEKSLVQHPQPFWVSLKTFRLETF